MSMATNEELKLAILLKNHAYTIGKISDDFNTLPKNDEISALLAEITSLRMTIARMLTARGFATGPIHNAPPESGDIS